MRGATAQPIASTLASQRIVEAIEAGSGALAHGQTYMSHPIACAAALAVLKAIDDEDLLANVAARGAQLRALLDASFRTERLLGFYAAKLGMTIDRLNEQVKRSTGVTAGHLIRQRVLTEAKRQLVFTTQPIHDISAELGFADPSHFARFFRKQTGTAPHEFRDRRGG